MLHRPVAPALLALPWLIKSWPYLPDWAAATAVATCRLLRLCFLAALHRARSARRLRRVGVHQIRNLNFLLAGPLAHVFAAAAAGARDADPHRVVGPDNLARCLRAGDGE